MPGEYCAGDNSDYSHHTGTQEHTAHTHNNKIYFNILFLYLLSSIEHVLHDSHCVRFLLDLVLNSFMI